MTKYKTKYDIGDKVYIPVYQFGDSYYESALGYIQTVHITKNSIAYTVETIVRNFFINELQCFSNKEDCEELCEKLNFK